VLCAAAILLLDSLPGRAIPTAPAGVDKVGHFTMYGALGFLAGTAAGAVWAPAAAVSAFGAFDEWHQQFVPKRSMDLRDWLADSAGALVGVGLAAARRRRRTAGTSTDLSGSRTDQLR